VKLGLVLSFVTVALVRPWLAGPHVRTDVPLYSPDFDMFLLNIMLGWRWTPSRVFFYYIHQTIKKAENGRFTVLSTRKTGEQRHKKQGRNARHAGVSQSRVN
jgi:hypothetical protein